MFGFLPGPSLCCATAAAGYRAHFCGLCNGLRRDYGLWARWLINRDSTFLALLGSALTPESPPVCRTTCCNPLGTPRQLLDASPALHYAAAVTICGLTAKLDDDAKDEHGPRRWLARAGGHTLNEASGRALGILHGLGFPVAPVIQALRMQPHAEEPAGDLSGAAQSTCFAYGEIAAHLGTVTGAVDAAPALRETGRHLGFLIYAQDAWEDWAADRRRKRFNPLGALTAPEERRAYLAPLLENALTGLHAAFAALPLRRYHSLLKIVLVEGSQRRLGEVLSKPEDSDRKPKKDDCCSWCSCGDCCHCPGGRSGGAGLCDCNPCDGDCCGCDCC